MGLMKKKKDKIKSVRAHTFITRKAALKKLQITLNEFRKLCILKGIYPRVPTDSKMTKSKTYYAVKDIIYLQHDPLISKFRNYKATLKKLTRRKARNELVELEKLKQNSKNYTLDHIIKERYPTFNDALSDLDDALCLVYIYANLAAQIGKAPLKVVHNCAKLVMEWEDYIMRTKSLRKVFVSVKGIYYQASVCGTTVTWLVPHNLVQKIPGSVDTRILKNFLELYQSLLGFVLFKLYADIGMSYPPTRMLPTPHLLELDNIKAEIEAEEKQNEQDNNMEEESGSNHGEGLKQLLNTLEQTDKARRQSETSSQKKTQQRIQTLNTQKLLQLEKNNTATEDNEQQSESTQKTQQAVAAFEAEVNKYVDAEKLTLFKDCKIFLSRESPVISLNFVIRCFGGQASWEGPYAPFSQSDDDITHHVADRNTQKHEYLTRCYVQPQWVYDSANERFLIPAHDYLPGAVLPPHLSPFVNDQEEGYIPDRKEQINKWKQAMQTGFTSIVDVLASEALELPDKSNGVEEEEEDDESEEEKPLQKKNKPTKPAAKKNQVQESEEEEYDEEFDLEEAADDDDNTFGALSSGSRYHDNEDNGQQQEQPEEDEEEEEKGQEEEEEEEEEDEAEAKYNAELKAERSGKVYEEDSASKKRKKSAQPDQTYDDQFAMSQMTKKNRKRFQSLKRQEKIKQEKVQALVDKKNSIQSKKNLKRKAK